MIHGKTTVSGGKLYRDPEKQYLHRKDMFRFVVCPENIKLFGQKA
jgi:hypothetical protein